MTMLLNHRRNLCFQVSVFCCFASCTIALGVSPEVLLQGRALFERDWPSQSPALGGDGLGPLFNAKSCVTCHHQGDVGGGGNARFNAFAVGIESHAGLTEPAVARRPLTARSGRVGHEKIASLDYLIGTRKAHITLSTIPGKLLKLKNYIPEIIVEFDPENYGRLLQVYGVHKATREARRKGYTVLRRQHKDGAIKLVIGGV